MARYIDAEAMANRLRDILKKHPEWEHMTMGLMNAVIRELEEEPTAYDLEKVLNELDEKYSRCKIRSRSIFSDNDYRYNDLKRHEKHSSDMQAYAYDIAIDIVKAGGVE